MSPNFVQRGEPAIIDKATRTQMALQAGVDLVIELPTIFALEHADLFAYGAVHLLHFLKVSSMVFGSETGNTDAFLARFSQISLFSPRSDELLQEYLRQGYGYPKAQAMALEAVHQFHLETPNDILGYAYYKVIQRERLPIAVDTIKRKSSEEHEILLNVNQFPSAKAVRHALLHRLPLGDAMPVTIPSPITHYASWDDYFPFLQHRLLTSTPAELREVHLMSEGLEYLLIQAARESNSHEEMIRRCVSKRYSVARLNRTLLHVLLNTNRKDAQLWLQAPPPYIRPLGMNKRGQDYLHYIGKNLNVPVIARFAKNAPLLLQYEKRASDVYWSIFSHQQQDLLRRKELYDFPIRDV
jgi:predicted nucleotidyltransferase